MARYQIIVPEGEVLLKDAATGRTLRLSATDGPLVIGTAELSLLPGWEEVPAAPGDAGRKPGQEAADVIAEKAATTRPSGTPVGMPDEVEAALARLSRLPPGFGEEAGEPFLSDASPVTLAAGGGELPAERTLEAPLEALTQADFEATLASLGSSRDNVEHELGFLREIESEPEDIEELERLDEALEARYGAVSRRFEDWKRLQERLDEMQGTDGADDDRKPEEPADPR